MSQIKSVELTRLSGLVAVLGLGLAACSSSTPPSTANSGSCTPNQSIVCACPDGVSQGAKLCTSSGQYGACLPCASGTAGTTATSGTSGGAGSSTGTAGTTGGICTPNQQVSCKCPDGVSQGLTLCDANGQPYGTCLPCNARTAGASGGGGAGTAGAGGAGAGGAGGTGGTGGTGGAGGSAGTTATPGCPSSLMCTDVGQLLGMPGLKVCASGFFPPACDSSMQCPTLPGASCAQGYCIKPCT